MVPVIVVAVAGGSEGCARRMTSSRKASGCSVGLNVDYPASAAEKPGRSIIIGDVSGGRVRTLELVTRRSKQAQERG